MSQRFSTCGNSYSPWRRYQVNGTNYSVLTMCLLEDKVNLIGHSFDMSADGPKPWLIVQLFTIDFSKCP